MNNGKFGFGIVGTGAAAETHARQIQELPEAAVTAVYGRNANKAREFAARFGVKQWYSDFRRLLDDRGVDIVDVITPHGAHQEFAVPAAKAGKHVVVEKPIETTLDRADAIIEACREHNVKLSVIYQMRFGNEVRRLKQAVDSGRFGRIVLGAAYDKGFRDASYYATKPWKASRAESGGGCVMISTIHFIDLLLWVMGPVETVVAKRKTATHDIDVEDVGAAIATFRNGAIGVVESSTSTYPSFKSWIEVHGERGSAIVSGEYDQTYLWNVMEEPDAVDAPKNFQFRDVTDAGLYPELRQRYQLQDVIDAIKENRLPLVTGEEARRSLAFVLAMYESAETGREVSVET